MLLAVDFIMLRKAKEGLMHTPSTFDRSLLPSASRDLDGVCRKYHRKIAGVKSYARASAQTQTTDAQAERAIKSHRTTAVR
jgi:hypothetical protein